ncbi:MAG: amidohydrolase family protein [Solirubrobacterales bacterium]
MRVDVHSHYNPPKFWEKYEQLGAYDQEGTFFARVPRGGSLDDPPLSAGIEAMDEAGVDIQVMSASATQPYFRPEAMAVEAARFTNDLYAEAVAEFPDRLRAFGCLPLPHIDAAIAEIGRCYDELGFVGFSLGCSVIGEPLDDEKFNPLWEELDRRAAVVYFHPGTENALGVGGGDFHLDADFGSPCEMAISMCRLLIRGVTVRYPDIKWTLATLGGSLPFLANRFDSGFKRFYPDRYEEFGGMTRHLRSFHYDTSTCEEPLALLCAREAFGVDQLVLGSDAPRIRSAVPAVEYVEQSPYLSAADARQILDRNGAALIGV